MNHGAPAPPHPSEVGGSSCPQLTSQKLLELQWPRRGCLREPSAGPEPVTGAARGHPPWPGESSRWSIPAKSPPQKDTLFRPTQQKTSHPGAGPGQRFLCALGPGVEPASPGGTEQEEAATPWEGGEFKSYQNHLWCLETGDEAVGREAADGAERSCSASVPAKGRGTRLAREIPLKMTGPTYQVPALGPSL